MPSGDGDAKQATHQDFVKWSKALADFKWDRVDLLLQNHDFFPAPQNRLLIIELCRFLLMKAMVLDLSADKLSPSGMLDVAWHSVILFPRAYSQICTSLLPPELSEQGYTLDHNPLGLDDYNNSLRYEHTLAVYRDTFGLDPPALFWPPNVPSDWLEEEEEEDLSTSAEGSQEGVHVIRECGKRKFSEVEKESEGRSAQEVSKGLAVRVRTLLGEEFTVKTGDDWSIGKLKREIESFEGTPADRQRLLLGAAELKDDTCLLSSYKESLLDHGAIHLLQKLKGC
eukprot:CAMPEP_0197848368 /NCGR_PEP_ID=MMETSP1438-20131217/8524_1 /TAXON_ID=1461541 /ORGANISM="Pterosperma sp., Strain CCMP1384" /LENGTH=282 /DNA_ID=CAMNT_0043460577 /DNA_START=125 /DNA_END=973 /DNA_ORIENTATION=+